MRRSLGIALIASALVPASATADGLPIGVDAGGGGVTTAGASERYVTLPARGSTVVARVRRDGGEVVRSRALRGTFVIPAVALDGTASGLSADGRTLVLIRPRAAFPRSRTQFAVLDAHGLKLRERIRMRGDFSYDAMSPDGRTLYLIQYLSRRDPTRYAVRAMDLRSGRLARDPIVDPREPDERMRGFPITRATSAGGRWEYTLYDGAGSHPFVHALDTVGRTATCIDLDALAGHGDLAALRLAFDGGKLIVRDPTGPLLAVDRATFRVSEPAAPARVAPSPPRDGSGAPWALLGVAAAVAIAGGAALAVRRRHAVPA
jgi:hypothetical protein